MKSLRVDQVLNILVSGTPLLDVRAPVEFLAGSIPGAVNLPILDDEERRIIGTTYKNQGADAAVALGYQLVSGENKSVKIKQWLDFLNKYPDAILYCFRGGQRSQITQSWLSQEGYNIPIIEGGYKAVRQALIKVYEDSERYRQRLVTVVGPTGVGKTDFLNVVSPFISTIDLEGIAKHRGSAFGSVEAHEQPTQINFENALSLAILRIFASENWSNGSSILIEDESRLIGRRALPEPLMQAIKEAPVIWLEEPLLLRVENIFRDYIINTSIGSWQRAQSLGDNSGDSLNQLSQQAQNRLLGYRQSLVSIQRRLGGLLFSEIMNDLDEAIQLTFSSCELDLHKRWIEKLLVKYYDPMYLSSLERRSLDVVFKGSFEQARSWIEKSKRA